MTDNAQGWRPIESAHHIIARGDTAILWNGVQRGEGFYDTMMHAWAWWPVPAHEPLDWAPTHWQPLPTPPEDAAP